MTPTTARRDCRGASTLGIWSWLMVLSFLAGCGTTTSDPSDREEAVIDLTGELQLASFYPAADVDGGPDDEVPVPEVRTGRLVVLRASGSLVVPIERFANQAILRFEFREQSGENAGQASVSVSVLDGEGLPREPATFRTSGPKSRYGSDLEVVHASSSFSR